MICTYRASAKDACRCPNIGRDVPMFRHWKDGKKPALKTGDAICTYHADVPGCMRVP